MIISGGARLSKVSFVLESKRINQIKIELQYDCHDNIDVILSTKPSIDVIENKYMGILEAERNESVLLKAKLYLLMYLDIIPRLLQSYYDEKENDLWSMKVKNEFFKTLGDELTNKILERVESEE